MKRISWLLIVPLALVGAFAPVACVENQIFNYVPGTSSSSSTGGMGGEGGTTSSTGGMGGSGGNAIECTKLSDCVATECKSASTCAAGLCVWNFNQDGNEVSSQLYGDCQTRVCDGKGNVKLVPGDPTIDAYDWANKCYKNDCNATTNPMPTSEACTTSWNTMGTCTAEFKCIECTMPDECASNICIENRCLVPTCVDGTMNGSETDIDCGGMNCLPCKDGKACTTNSDCEGSCNMGTCLAPTCGDGAKNTDETDIDCGGSCAKGANAKKCIKDQKCLFPIDCESGVCRVGVCQAPSCSDQTQNGGEDGVDCGGTCPLKCQPAP